MLRKMIIIITLAFFFCTLAAPPFTVGYITRPEVINPYEAIIKAITDVESSGNSLAYNPKENAVGAFQIRQIRIDEYNRLTGDNFALVEMYDYSKAIKVFMYYTSQFEPWQHREIARDWNKSVTNKYWNKVRAELLNIVTK